ncbi:MAG: FAD-dependent oxidoreductase [Thermoprotei archaeon]|nr:MAG: FAD-dependent oxidoreductase [Thermoprotei archaeon]RLF18288.1 MAG: FAD-dependent oxidoreductase [Thermoprotei archaeon]
MKYDVAIVGAGPAGIFTALELTKRSDLKVILIDKGNPLTERKCPVRSGYKCARCKPCSVLSGWGGAGAFSDGKLTLSVSVGGWLSSVIGKNKLHELINYVDSIYLKFGAPNVLYGTDEEAIASLARKASRANLRLVPMKVRHMGTERAQKVSLRMFNYLKEKVDILLRTEVKDIKIKNTGIKQLILNNGKRIEARHVVLAPGRAGAPWMKRITEKLGVPISNNPVDLGVRVEVPAVVMEELTDVLYDVKLVYYSKSFDDRVRTFCVNPYGEVITEFYDDIITVNGQSCISRRTENTNFAILVTMNFTEPFREPIEYGRHIAKLANMLGDSVLIQRLGDLRKGRRSTPERIRRSPIEPTLKNATPGDLSFVLPYRILTNIIEMLDAMNDLTPGVASDYTLLYGVEVKFYSIRVSVDSRLRMGGIRGLYAIGDGAGITRGLIQASASGVLAAHSILTEEGYQDKDLSLEDK